MECSTKYHEFKSAVSQKLALIRKLEASMSDSGNEAVDAEDLAAEMDVSV